MPSTSPRSANRSWRTSSLRLILLLTILLSTLAAGSPSSQSATIPVPYNVQATTDLPYKITVSWDAIGDFYLDHFDIIVYGSLSGSYRIVGEEPSYGTGSYSYDIFLDDFNYFAYEDYQIAVMACPENGYWCNDVSAQVTGSGIIAPPHLTATSGTYSDRVEISFQEWIPDAYRRYEIYRSASPGGPFTKIGQLTSYLHSTNQNLFVDSAVVPGTTYYYSGIICNDNQPYVTGGCSEPSLIPAQGHASLTSPGIEASDGTSHEIVVSWDPIPGAIFYQLFRTNTNTAPDPDLDVPLKSDLAGTTWTDEGMPPYNKYYYWVRAYAGSPATYTALSDSDSGWRTYDIATNIVVSQGTSPTSVDLVWINQDDAILDFYQIYRAEAASGTPEVIGASTTMSFSDLAAVPGITYYYWIKSCDMFLRCSPMTGPLDGWRALGDPPTITAIGNQTISEDTATGALAFTVDDTETDPGVLQVTGSSSNTTLLPDANIVLGGSGSDRTVTLTPAANQNGSATVTITVTDPSLQTDTTTFTLTVNPANDPPTDLSLSNDSLDENEPAGTVVGTLSTTDLDTGDSHTYSLVAGAGDTDNASFTIVGDELQSAVVFDYETQNTFSVRIQTEDSGGATHEEGFAITINDLDDIPPDVGSILRADPSPCNTSSVDYTVSFTESVTGLDTGDFSLTTSGLTGASVSAVSGSGSTYTVTVNTGSGSGTLRLDLVDDDSVQDLAGNPLGGLGANNGDFTTGQSYTLDRDLVQVTSIVTADPDPTNDPSVEFDIRFNQVVTGVDLSDFSLTASGISGASVTALMGGGDFYTAVVNTGTGSGTLRLDISDDDSIADLVGNLLGGTGAGNGDFTTGEYFTIDRQDPVVAGSTPADLAIVNPGPTEITVEFSEDVLGDASADAANNTTNYLLFKAGPNAVFDTPDCAGYPGLSGDDLFFSIDSAVYDNNAGAGPFQTLLGINAGTPLPVGDYRLLVCGTTSVVDLVGNTINAGNDVEVNFTVQEITLPDTGFAPGRVTVLPAGAPGTAYQQDSGLSLRIPVLGIQQEIVGVPLEESGWDLTWLEGNVGWLEGTAYPTWEGNTALTAHVYLASGLPGPFVKLDQLRWGDRILIRAFGQRYTYQVRSLDYVRSDVSWPITTHEEYDWITLITCRSFDEATGGYRWRTVVRAVLVDVSPE